MPPPQKTYDLTRFSLGERYRWPSKHRDRVLTVVRVELWSDGKNGEVSFVDENGREVSYTFGKLSVGKLEKLV
jgi:hypothetical protein